MTMKTTSVRLTDELHARVQASELTIPQLIERGLNSETEAMKMIKMLHWAITEGGGKLVVVRPGQTAFITTAGEQPDKTALTVTAHCRECDLDIHACKGCGRPVPHGFAACAGCLADIP